MLASKTVFVCPCINLLNQQLAARIMDEVDRVAAERGDFCLRISESQLQNLRVTLLLISLGLDWCRAPVGANDQTFG